MRRISGRRRLVLLLIACILGGTCGAFLTFVSLPPARTPAASTAPESRCSATFAAKRHQGIVVGGRGGRWHSGQSSGGSYQQRKSFVNFFSVAVLGFFGWSGGPESASAEEGLPKRSSSSLLGVDDVRTFLLNSGIAGSAAGGSEGKGGRRDALKRFFSFGGEAEQGSKRKRKKERAGHLLDVFGGPKSEHPDSASASTNRSGKEEGGWPSWLPFGRRNSEEKSEGSLELVAPDKDGGPFAFLLAIKVAIFSVLFGDRDEEEEEDPSKVIVDVKATTPVAANGVPAVRAPPALELPSPEFPNPEEWLESAKNAALSLPLAASEGSAAPAEREDQPAAKKPEDRAVEAKPEEEEEEKEEAQRPEAAAAAQQSEPEEVEPVEVNLDDRPPPNVPGLDKSDLVVRVEIEPKKVPAKLQGEPGVQALMRQSGGDILAVMGESGWKVEEVDASKGIFKLSLPSVRYDLLGCRVSIPAPVFQVTLVDSFQRTGDYEERLQGDLVLLNGEELITVEFKFPFGKTFSISAAGWTRSRIGWERGGVIVTSNFIEIGLQLPKVPGLEKIMEIFVRNYGTESTKNCAVALANGSDVISLEEPWWESAQQAAQQAVSESARGITEALSGASSPPGDAAAKEGGEEEQGEEAEEEEGPEPEAPAPAPAMERKAGEHEAERQIEGEQEWWESAQDAMSKSAREVEINLQQQQEAVQASVLELSSVLPKDRTTTEETPTPDAPGMDEANLVVHTDVDPKSASPDGLDEADSQVAVSRLMAQPGGTILATMAQEGWEVKPIDEGKNLYEMALPSVRYEIAGAVVSIPAPRFNTTVYDTFVRDGDYEERLFGDLVLMNGDEILTVELGFPFRTQFTISASGWCRAIVGSEKDKIVISAIVEIGLQLPKFPGLEPIMKFFVKSYGMQSTLECTQALARGAEALPDEGAPPEWLKSGIDAVAEKIGSVLPPEEAEKEELGKKEG